MNNEYFVYLVECKDKTIYCGYTNNLDKRINNHNNSIKGAKYTKNRRPVRLIYFESFDNKSSALKREHFIKKLTRDEKLNLIAKRDAADE